MFVGCSEISISAIVKHVQHTGIARVFYLSGETEKIVQLLFVRKGISTLKLKSFINISYIVTKILIAAFN